MGQIDGVNRIVEWATSKNFGVMDINVPRNAQTDQPWYTPSMDDGRLQAEVKELMCYLWDNYLQLYEADQIFIVGVGYAYLGIKMLLLNRSDASPPGAFLLGGRAAEPHRDTPIFYYSAADGVFLFNTDCRSKLSGVVSFVNGHLRPVRSDVDESLSHWYKNNSRVFVTDNHACWIDPKLEAKIKKRRFGTVIRSPELGLNAMMKRHFHDMTDFILKSCTNGGDDTTEDDRVGA